MGRKKYSFSCYECKKLILNGPKLIKKECFFIVVVFEEVDVFRLCVDACRYCLIVVELIHIVLKGECMLSCCLPMIKCNNLGHLEV